MNDLQEQFNQLDVKQCLLIGLGIAVFYYFLVFDDGSRLRSRIATTKKTLTTKQGNLANVRKALENQKKFEADIDEITSNMRDFQTYFNDDMDQNGLFEKVSTFAEESGVVVEKLTPKEKKKEFTDYKEIAVEFTIEGSFHNVMEFVSRLTQMNKAIDFHKMSFKTVVGGDFPVIKLETVLVVYSLEPKEEPNA